MERVSILKQSVRPKSRLKIYKTSKHYPSPVREWKDSVYVFNKHSMNLIPSTTKLVTNYIKSYFDAYNKDLDEKMRSKALKFRLKRLSTNKFYVSNGGFKHTNNRVKINLYVFNRQKNNYLLTLKNWYIKNFFLSKILENPHTNKVDRSVWNGQTDISKNINSKFIKKLNIIKHKGLQTAMKITNDKYSYVKGLNTCLLNQTNSNFDYNMSSVYKIKNFSNYTKSFYIDLIKKSLKKIRMYFFYKQLLYINKSKLNYTYLFYLKKCLEKIYKKNVEFNIINMKKFYLNSDIATQAISSKLTKNRRKILTYLNMFKNKIKITKKKVYSGYKLFFVSKPQNLVKNLSKADKDNFVLQTHVINDLKYKDITGFKLEAKGRLTKRFAAARAVFKHKSKGGLYDIDSSFRNLSSVLLKGNLKSNTQYTNLKSKTRIGSFGLKGWVSGN